MAELTGSDDLLGGTTHAPYGNGLVESDGVLFSMELFNTSGISEFKPIEDYQFVDAPQPLVRRGSSSSLEDVERLINREMNREVPHYEFRVLENDKTRSTTHEMVDHLLFAMPNKDIPIEVKGAQGGHVVKVGLRYTTGVHHNTPVLACKTHDDSSDPGFSFYVPKISVMKIDELDGHRTVEIPVPANVSPGGSFSFSLVFRCLNSCHRDYGKDQEMILKLCDLQDKILKETHINLRVCKNVNRDRSKKDRDKDRGRSVLQGRQRHQP